MTYQLERSAIETYIIAQWGGATPLILDGHAGEPVANSISIDIQSGSVLQGSVGRASNRIDYVGLLQIVIYTEAGKGSAADRGYRETLAGIFRNARLTSAGVTITDPADEFLRFSPGEQHPYIAGTQVEAGLRFTTLNAPFIRYGVQ